jgi:hypothetical protein
MVLCDVMKNWNSKIYSSFNEECDVISDIILYNQILNYKLSLKQKSFNLKEGALFYLSYRNISLCKGIVLLLCNYHYTCAISLMRNLYENMLTTKYLCNNSFHDCDKWCQLAFSEKYDYELWKKFSPNTLRIWFDNYFFEKYGYADSKLKELYHMLSKYTHANFQSENTNYVYNEIQILDILLFIITLEKFILEDYISLFSIYFDSFDVSFTDNLSDDMEMVLSKYDLNYNQ